MTLAPTARLLRQLTGPSDLRALPMSALSTLAQEIRELLIDSVSRSGGHLGPNLGVVELTIALHRVFESPRDPIVFDTGHQSYVHKILTGRGNEFDSLRQAGGLSGYPSRTESAHDVMENSHASTALSYADGLAKAFALRGEKDRRVVAVVGDGALTGGMSWEALNNIGGAQERPVIVVLNDNGRSYSPTVGGLAHHLAELRRCPRPNLFEDLGLAYLGPIDGHDLVELELALRSAERLRRPVVVHCVTRKGKGHLPAEEDPTDCLHTVSRPVGGKPGTGWTSVFSDELVKIATRRPDVVGLTAAMPGPTGLHGLANAFPGRVFDVGIAEQHAVTSAAGLAIGGLHPVVAIYATFLGRAFDQVLMDVALHRLPVTFVLDRSGVTGDDGPSHHGMWDLSLLRIVPGLRIAAPRDGTRLRRLLAEAVSVDDRPTVLRFPKGPVGPDVPAVTEFGGVDLLYRPERRDVLLVTAGASAREGVLAADLLRQKGIGATVVDPRWVSPVNATLLTLAAEHRMAVCAEDNTKVGGAGAGLVQAITDARIDVPVHVLGLPGSFLPHSARSELLRHHRLDADGIAETIIELMDRRQL